MSRLKVPNPQEVMQRSSAELAALPTPECKTLFYPSVGYMLVARSYVGDISTGGILLPDMAKVRRRLSEGHVIRNASGSQAKYPIGLYITWDENASYDMEDAGFKFVLVPESSVLLVIYPQIPRSNYKISQDLPQPTHLQIPAGI